MKTTSPLSASLMLTLVLGASSCTPAQGDPAPAAAPACLGPSFEGSPLSIRCGALVDERGREVRLHGINARVEGVFDVVLDGGRTPLEPILSFGPTDARRMRELGWNALRLPIQWSGVEPTETGGFDEDYVARIRAAVDVAHAEGLFVLVDFHQDAYSKEIGEDGAPYWAILPPPPAKLEGPLDDLTDRRISKPVVAAFKTFFGSSPEGAWLRDRFGKMAAHVASRFADHPGVIGFELFNEPQASNAQLDAFHAALLPVVQAAAPKKLVFFEPLAIRNVLNQASIPDAPLGPGTVYSPHVYTNAFGSAAARAAATEDALRLSYEAAREEAKAWEAPLVITEMGFPPSDPRFAEYMGWHASLADELGASAFYWLWKEKSQGSWGVYDYDAAGQPTERANVVAAFSRARIEACAGRVEQIDRTAESIRVTFDGTETTNEHRFSLGSLLTADSAACDGHPAPVTPLPSGVVTIACGGAGRHVVELRTR